MKKRDIEPLFPLIRNIGDTLREILAARFPEEDIRKIFFSAERHFQESIPYIPEVGADNPWLKSILGVTFLTGIWLELEARNWNMTEISTITQKALGKTFARGITPEKLAAIQAAMCSPEAVRKIAERSQLRRFPDDWICRLVIPCDDDAFQIGIDVTQCPIKQLCERLRVERFFPYFCVDDYVMHAAAGIDLKRTQTIAHGAAYCDFRLTPLAGPFWRVISAPETLPEFQSALNLRHINVHENNLPQ